MQNGTPDIQRRSPVPDVQRSRAEARISGLRFRGPGSGLRGLTGRASGIRQAPNPNAAA